MLENLCLDFLDTGVDFADVATRVLAGLPLPDEEKLPQLLDPETSTLCERNGVDPTKNSLTNFGMGFQASPFDTVGKRQICANGAMIKHRFADALELQEQPSSDSEDGGSEDDDFPSTARALSRMSMPEAGYASTRGSGFGAASVVARAHTPDSAALEKQVVEQMNRELSRRTDALRNSLEGRLSPATAPEQALFDKPANPDAKIQPTEIQEQTASEGRAGAARNAEVAAGRRAQLQESMAAEAELSASRGAGAHSHKNQHNQNRLRTQKPALTRVSLSAQARRTAARKFSARPRRRGGWR